MAAKHSYVFHLLSYLRDGEPRSNRDIDRYLEGARRQPRNLEEVLNSLRGIGVLGTVDRGVTRQWFSMAAHRQGDGGGGSTGGPPNRRAGAGGDGEGGVGLGEVLAHPVLLCLPEDAQYALLDAAFDTGLLDNRGIA